MKIKIATWNVNGIRARQAQLCEWLARDRPDIVMIGIRFLGPAAENSNLRAERI